MKIFFKEINAILILSLMVSCASQKSTFDIFNGEVESVEIHSWTFNEISKEKQLFSIKKYFLNEKGLLIKANEYDIENGQLEKKTFIKYDTNKHQIEDRFVFVDGQMESMTTDCKYDDNGNFSEVTYYNTDSSSNYRMTFKYNENGLKTETLNYDSDSMLTTKIEIKYDSQENVTEKKVYKYSDGNFYERMTEKYEYDKKGHQKAYYRYVCDDLKYKSLSKYTTRGYLKIHKVYLHGENLSYTEIYRYNMKGDEKVIKRYNEVGKLEAITTYEYKYDNKGNQTERKTFYNQEPFEIKKMTYKYRKK